MTDARSSIPQQGHELPQSGLGRWFRADHADGADHSPPPQPWWRVLWLTGVDYFSTLGYQPGIALLAAGVLAPVATAILVLVTLLCAVPVYFQVARRSYAGQGSIAMLESMLPGWKGASCVLVLLGFAATDFVITMTLSAADAAKHAVENPLLHGVLGDHQILVTLVLLALLAAVFLKGFREAVGVAMAVAIPYLLLNAVVLVVGAVEIAHAPYRFDQWRLQVVAKGDWPAIALAAAILFPRLALGLSGFETGVSVMPHIAGAEGDSRTTVPAGRIRGTRKLLVTAALVMSVFLLASSVVTTLLISPEASGEGGPAAGRALSYLAHGLLGHGFGTIYDLWSIAILWFAGASAMAALLNLVPRYLPRLGMAPHWTAFRRPLVVLLFVVCIAVTLAFDADVESQAGAYATGVLVLLLSAAVAVALSFQREAARLPSALGRFGNRGKSLVFWLVSAVFAFTLVDNVIERPDGVVIAAIFVVAIVIGGALSRMSRATELRVSAVTVRDPDSAALWESIRGRKVHLVPLRTDSPEARSRKRGEIAEHYRAAGALAFLHVKLTDNRSEFISPLAVSVERIDGDFLIRVTGAVAIANTIACVSELLDPRSIFLTLTRGNLMTQSLRFLLLGEGEIGLLVYKILLRYWAWTREDDVRPNIFLMSE